MLVLTRRLGESIVFDEGRIIVTVTKIDGDRVKIGIEAPPDTEVYREEVFKRIQKGEPKRRFQ